MIKLNENLKKQLIEWVGQIEIDVKRLDSYIIDRNPYGLEPALIGTSACGVWDENEEWQAQIERAKTLIEADGAGEYLQLSPEDWDNEDDNDCTTLTHECLYYLGTLED